MKISCDHAYRDRPYGDAIAHGIGIVFLDGSSLCNPMLISRSSINSSSAELFGSVEACLELMSEINKVPRVLALRDNQVGLEQLTQYSLYKEFVRSAFNIDTIFPLNQTHCLVLIVKSNNGQLSQLVSFHLLKVREICNIIGDNDLALLCEEFFSISNHLRCVFFEEGKMSKIDKLEHSDSSRPNLTVSESQAIAREHFVEKHEKTFHISTSHLLNCTLIL